MAAVRSPLMPSPSTGIASAFNHFTDPPASPSASMSVQGHDRSSTDAGAHLLPQPQKSPQFGSNLEIAEPSPIASSNGTDIDDTAGDEPSAPIPASAVTDPGPRGSIQVATKDADGNDFRPGSAEDDHPSSVIHAPKNFDPFAEVKASALVGRVTPTPSQRSEATVVPPPKADESEAPKSEPPLSPPPISTSVPPTHDAFTTPLAQTRHEAESDRDRSKGRSKSLEDIPEKDTEADEEQTPPADRSARQTQRRDNEMKALRTALAECWTLCNTLAGLSHVHRKRAFGQTGRRDRREQAWESCWTLCQELYATWDAAQPAPVLETLDMCREFCQCLFDVRQRDNDLADSVLRVSFELNNHLYNTHDRKLPDAFRERTLDFYITLCHRLMKQRNRMAEETDNLLRACWSLAEMLFSLRQNKREGKSPDEELLGSAVQACWELCDLFREGWTQVRPDRGTPRPSQANFTPGYHPARDGEAITVTLDETDDEDDDIGRLNPETPTTIFEDTQQLSPDDPSVPNIVVLGPDTFESRFAEWPSSASTRSGYASSDEKTTSSTATIHPTEPNERDDPRLTCLRILVVRAAITLGFHRQGTESFSGFVKSLSSHSLGSQHWQVQLLEQYKGLVARDPTFRQLGPLHRANTIDIARSVSWMVSSGECAWLRDLFRFVFGFRIDEAGSRPSVWIEG